MSAGTAWRDFVVVICAAAGFALGFWCAWRRRYEPDPWTASLFCVFVLLLDGWAWFRRGAAHAWLRAARCSPRFRKVRARPVDGEPLTRAEQIALDSIGSRRPPGRAARKAHLWPPR